MKTVFQFFLIAITRETYSKNSGEIRKQLLNKYQNLQFCATVVSKIRGSSSSNAHNNHRNA